MKTPVELREESRQNPAMLFLVAKFPEAEETIHNAFVRSKTGLSDSFVDALKDLVPTTPNSQGHKAAKECLEYCRKNNGDPVGNKLELALVDKYRFSQLTGATVSKLLRMGLTEVQVMGCELYAGSFTDDVAGDTLRKTYVDRISNAIRDEIMQDRSFFQKQYEKRGPLPLSKAGEMLSDSVNAELIREELRREADERERRKKDAETERKLAAAKAKEELEQKKARNKGNLVKLRALPENFTLDDL